MSNALTPLPVPPTDRRLQEGVAICTERPAWLLPHLADAQILARHLAIQTDAAGRAALPNARPPLVLDTVGLDPLRLVELLLDLLRRPLVTVALVSDTARAAAHLVQLCPAVVLALDTSNAPHDPALFGRLREPLWMLANMDQYALRMTQRLLDPRPALIFSNVFILHILAALARAETVDDAARACHISRATFMRHLQQARAEVGLPAGMRRRLPPPLLAARLLQALEHAAPARVSTQTFG